MTVDQWKLEGSLGNANPINLFFTIKELKEAIMSGENTTPGRSCHTRYLNIWMIWYSRTFWLCLILCGQGVVCQRNGNMRLWSLSWSQAKEARQRKPGKGVAAFGCDSFNFVPNPTKHLPLYSNSVLQSDPPAHSPQPQRVQEPSKRWC